MTEGLQVEFETVAKDFQNGVQQLTVNHEDFKATDVAEIKVGLQIGLFSVGTRTSVDGRATQFGDARMPLAVLEKLGQLAMQFGKKIVAISIKDGEARVEKTSVKHREISVGERSSSPAAIPVNASALDILATAEAMPKSDISDAGLKARLARALEDRDAAVGSAFNALKEFGVEEVEVQELVDRHIREIAKGVKKALGKNRGIHSV